MPGKKRLRGLVRKNNASTEHIKKSAQKFGRYGTARQRSGCCTVMKKKAQKKKKSKTSVLARMPKAREDRSRGLFIFL